MGGYLNYETFSTNSIAPHYKIICAISRYQYEFTADHLKLIWIEVYLLEYKDDVMFSVEKSDPNGNKLQVVCLPDSNLPSDTIAMAQNIEWPFKLVDAIVFTTGVWEYKHRAFVFPDMAKLRKSFREGNEGRLIYRKSNEVPPNGGFQSLFESSEPLAVIVIKIEKLGNYICGIPSEYQPPKPSEISLSSASGYWRRSEKGIDQCDGPDCLNKYNQKCGKCGTVKYCCKVCQEADWKRHKPTCMQFREWKSDTIEKMQNLKLDNNKSS